MGSISHARPPDHPLSCCLLILSVGLFFDFPAPHSSTSRSRKMRALPILLLAAAVTQQSSGFHSPSPQVTRARRGENAIRIDPSDRARVTHSSSAQSSTALMGIPKMFRWLTDQYPNILNRRLGSATSIPHVDNFYLDSESSARVDAESSCCVHTNLLSPHQ